MAKEETENPQKLDIDELLQVVITKVEKQKRGFHQLVFDNTAINIGQEKIIFKQQGWDEVTKYFKSDSPTIVTEKLIRLSYLLNRGKLQIVRV